MGIMYYVKYFVSNLLWIILYFGVVGYFMHIEQYLIVIILLILYVGGILHREFRIIKDKLDRIERKIDNV